MLLLSGGDMSPALYIHMIKVFQWLMYSTICESWRLVLSCSERVKSYKISSQFHEKKSGFLEVAFQLPYLALNLVLRVKDVSVLLFIYLFFWQAVCGLSGTQFPLWQQFLISLSEQSLLSDTFLFEKYDAVWLRRQRISHGTARITRFFQLYTTSAVPFSNLSIFPHLFSHIGIKCPDVNN